MPKRKFVSSFKSIDDLRSYKATDTTNKQFYNCVCIVKHLHRKLHHAGYVVLENHFTDEDIKVLRDSSRRAERTTSLPTSVSSTSSCPAYHVIFNDKLFDGIDTDETEQRVQSRFQAYVGTDLLTHEHFDGDFNAWLRKRLQFLLSVYHTVNKPVFLKSTGGDFLPQRPHQDYEDSESKSWVSNEVPLGLLIPLEESGMDLHVWKCAIQLHETGFGDMLPAENFRTIHVKKRGLLLFRGDLVHAGASYPEDNVRFHCNLALSENSKGNSFTLPNEDEPTITVNTNEFTEAFFAEHERRKRLGLLSSSNTKRILTQHS